MSFLNVQQQIWSVQVCNALKKANVEIYSGPRLSSWLTFGPPRAEKFAKEYGGQLYREIQNSKHVWKASAAQWR